MTGNFGFGVAGQAKVNKMDPSGARALGAGIGKSMSKDKLDEDAYNKFAKDVNVSQVHRLDQEDADKEAQKTLVDIRQIMKDNPHNYYLAVQKRLNEHASYQQKLISRKKNLDDLESQYDVISKAKGITSPTQDAMMNAIRSGSHDDVMQLHDPNENDQTIQVNPYTKDYSMNFLPQENLHEIKTSFAKDPNHYSKEVYDLKTHLNGSNGTIKLPNGKSMLVTEKMIPELAATKGGMEAMNDPHIFQAEKYSQIKSGRLDAIQIRDMQGNLSAPKNYKDMNQDELKQAIVQNWSDDVMNLAGVKSSQQILTPPAAKNPPKEPAEKTPLITEETPQVENHNQMGTTGKALKDEANVTTVGGIGFSKPISAVVSGVSYYDPATQSMNKDMVGARKISFQNIRAYRTVSVDIKDKDGKVKMHKGTILHDGKFPKSKTKVELMIPVVKSAISDGTGGDQGQTIYIPYSAVEAQLKLKPSEKKQLDDIKNRLTSAGTTPVSSAPSTAPSSSSTEVARKTKDGKVAIFDSVTKKFIRYQ